ncbi:MAG: BrnT family toxin [wastewater metagenome]|nr:BrnT family toxin [Candidatus Loosdrechtia aerotolerans]
MDILSNINGFEWDKGNIAKNRKRHGVTYLECEGVFFNNPVVVKNDVTHSTTEPRHYVLGKTNGHRLLFLVFTVRNNKIRIISARDMSKKERKIYEQAEKDTEI